jgi:hypothetical protein
LQDKTSGSLARFKKMQLMHAKKDVDLSKSLEKVRYSWKTPRGQHHHAAAAATTATTATTTGGTAGDMERTRW